MKILSKHTVTSTTDEITLCEVVVTSSYEAHIMSQEITTASNVPQPNIVNLI